MGVRRSLLGALMVAALGLVAPPATLADTTLQPSGALVYTWHGDPARGCARMGGCGVTGMLIIRPQGSIDVSSAGRRSAMLSLGGVAATARVRRTDPGSQGTCVDAGAGASLIGAINATWSPTGVLRASLATPPSSGRCAGPTARDLGRLALHGTYRAARRLRFDLRDTVPFAAGPYSGTLVSTVQLRRYAPPGGPLFSSGGSSGGGSGSGGPPPHGRRMEQLELDYRVALAPATLTLGFAGAADPLCLPFDACGTHGDVGVKIAARTVTLSLMATRRAPRRVGRAEALRAFAAGRFWLMLPGPSAAVPARVVETIARSGGPTCGEGQAAALALALGNPFAPGRSVVPLVLSVVSQLDFTALDPLRTHCPGPETQDMLSLTVLSQTTLTRPELLAARSAVELRDHGSFGAGGYTGTRSGAIALSLTLARAKVSTYTQYGGPAYGRRR